MTETATQTHRRDGPTRAWSLEVSDAPDALMRILSLLRGGRCELLSVSFERGDRHRPSTRLYLRVRPDGGRPDALERRLSGLADVVELRRVS